LLLIGFPFLEGALNEFERRAEETTEANPESPGEVGEDFVLLATLFHRALNWRTACASAR
jgi:hypothetical protein